MFNYTPMSETEAMQSRFQLLPDGEYDAVITASEDKVSASGNPMMAVTLTVFDDSGKSQEIRDWIVFTPSMMWKAIHFADSAQLMAEYEGGTLCSDIARDKRLRVKIVSEEGSVIPPDKLKGKSLGSKYPDKNKVEDYIKHGEQQAKAASPDGSFDDDVPF